MTSLLSLLTGTDLEEHAASQKSAQLLAHSALESLASPRDRVPVLNPDLPALSSAGQLGQLYNARSDQIINHTNVFSRRPESKEIWVSKLGYYVVFLTENLTRQKRVYWDYPGVSVGGAEFSGGYAEYLDVPLSCATDYRMTMFKTAFSQSQDVLVFQLRDLLDPDVLSANQDATHVITGISYGARLRGDVEVANKGVLSDEEIRDKLTNSLESFVYGPLDKDKIEKELRRYEGFKFLAYCDIEMEDGKDSLSRFLKTAKSFDKKLAKMQMPAGVPLEYRLADIEVVRALAGLYKPSPRAYQVNEDSMVNIRLYLLEMAWLQSKLQKLCEMCEAGTIKVGKKDFEAIVAKRHSVDRAMEKYRGEVAEEYRKIREGGAGQRALAGIVHFCDPWKLRQFIEGYANPGRQAVDLPVFGTSA